MAVLLFILAVAWAVYLVWWARSRTEHRSVNSISSFSKHLSVLERTTPAHALGQSGGPTRIEGSPMPARATASLARPSFAPSPPRASTGSMSRRQARERRKNVLFSLVGAALVTLALTVLVGGPMIYLHLLADLALGGYVLLLVQTQRLAVDRQAKVRYLKPPVDYREQPAPLLLHHSVN